MNGQETSLFIYVWREILEISIIFPVNDISYNGSEGDGSRPIVCACNLPIEKKFMSY